MTELWSICLRALLVGGAICVIGQLLFDVAKLTPAHTMSVLVTAGSILGGLGWYDKLVEFAGFGAALPIVSFGNTLVKGATEQMAADGFWGIFGGMLSAASAGVAAAVIFAFIIAVVFKPKA